LAFFISAHNSYGQAVADVGGVVTDVNGARLPAVTVTITNKLNGSVQTLTTGDQGNYRAVALQPAPYEIRAEGAGFAAQVRALILTVGADATMDFRLSVAELKQSLSVADETPLVEVARSQPNSSIVSGQVEALPVLQRNFLVLAQLLPGSGPDNSTGRGGGVVVTKFGGPSDQRTGFTTVIDGGALDDAIQGSPTINVTQDAVQEFKVFRHQFDAEYGAALNATVTVVTKSGTNQFHGSGYYFGRDRDLTARNTFAATKPAFSEVRAGGTVGGPIVKDKTHFFAALEYNHVDTVRIIALPASNPFAAQQNGVFPSPLFEYIADLKVDHRISDSHSLFVRYAYDDQNAQRVGNVSSDSNQSSNYSRANSLVAQDNLVLSKKAVNTIRVHYLKQNAGSDPQSLDVNIVRPSITTGQTTTNPQHFPRSEAVLSDTVYLNIASHDIKIGGDFTYGSYGFTAHFFEHGQFTFTTDAPFDPNNPATWPISFTQQSTGVEHYNTDHVSSYVQDNWHLTSRIRLNLGLRYDLDTNLRLHSFYGPLLTNPSYTGLSNFVSTNGSNSYFSFQPRLGGAWDILGNGHIVLRAGWGIYTARNRPWFQLRTMNQITSSAVLIQNPQQLRFYPDINAVLGGKTLDQYLAAGGPRLLGTVIPNNFVLPRSQNTTVGTGWQISSKASLDADYVHDYADRQFGSLDANLPPSGALSASNPRPTPQFTQVLDIANFTKSWYDALEVQLRFRPRAANTLQLSYTLSRSYMDGVDFFNLLQGTQRTPRSQGYNPTDQRHNLTLAGSRSLPWKMEASLILRAVSGSPMKVQAGFDLDGDGSITGDRPAGLPITVGSGGVAQQLQLINNLRASRNLPPISRSLLNLDPFLSLDMRLTKLITFGERHRLELFMEGYNLTNYVSYQPFTVNMNIISPAFLIRTSAGDARQFQWGVRYQF
jgi:hypothetical protein